MRCATKAREWNDDEWALRSHHPNQVEASKRQKAPVGKPLGGSVRNRRGSDLARPVPMETNARNPEDGSKERDASETGLVELAREVFRVSWLLFIR